MTFKYYDYDPAMEPYPRIEQNSGYCDINGNIIRIFAADNLQGLCIFVDTYCGESRP